MNTPTRTTNKLHFEDLEPHRFEDMGYELLYRLQNWKLYIEQLKTIFKHVTEMPLVLYNGRKTPIFHFACASNNSTAIKIASQIINKRQSK